jgi:hypothetical protein
MHVDQGMISRYFKRTQETNVTQLTSSSVSKVRTRYDTTEGVMLVLRDVTRCDVSRKCPSLPLLNFNHHCHIRNGVMALAGSTC